MNKVILIAMILIFNTCLYAKESQKSMYASISTSLLNFGGSHGESLKNRQDIDTSDAPFELEIGVLQSWDKRLGIYYKVDSVEVASANNDYSTFGLSGILGLSTQKNAKALPFISYGVGYGYSDNSSDVSVIEMDISLGVNYSIEQFEISASVYRRGVLFSDSLNNNLYAVNGINVGAIFKF